MVSLLSLSRTQWTRKPWSFVTPVFQPARRADWKVGVTSMRSMESFLFLSDLLTAHEPELRKPLEIKKTIFRFMGSFNLQNWTRIGARAGKELPPAVTVLECGSPRCSSHESLRAGSVSSRSDDRE